MNTWRILAEYTFIGHEDFQDVLEAKPRSSSEKKRQWSCRAPLVCVIFIRIRCVLVWLISWCVSTIAIFYRGMGKEYSTAEEVTCSVGTCKGLCNVARRCTVIAMNALPAYNSIEGLETFCSKENCWPKASDVWY